MAYACETYLRVAEKARKRPPFFISPITGIFGDHLKAVAAREGIECSHAVIDCSGVALARACYRLVEERHYPVTLLFGGARVTEDFTGLVGRRTAATINYSTMQEILALDPPVQDSIHFETDPAVIAELKAKFSDFRTALTMDGLEPDDFEGFGPVQHFRNSFVGAWHAVLDAIAEARLPSLAKVRP